MKTKTQLFFIKSVLSLICVFIFTGFLMLNLNLKAFAATQSEQVVAKIGDTEYVDLKVAFSELSTNGGTLEFMENVVVDLSKEDWGDVSFSKQVIIEGNGATIIGLNRPLIMNVSNTIIKNLTIKDSNIQGLYTSRCNWNEETQSTAGAFIGFSADSHLENCHLLDSAVASKEYCGGLIGYNSDGTVKIVNCSVKNSTITGNSSTGGMVGHSNGRISITGTVSGNTVTSNNSANPEGWQGVVFGVLTGSSGNNISVIEETPSTSGNQSSIQIIGGRLTDVEFVGGKYFSNPAISGPNEYNSENADAIFSGNNGIVVNDDGSFSVKQVETVATILGNGQESDKNFSKDALKNAFEQLMANGGTLEFVQGVEIDLSLINWGNMTTSKNVVINGNGATITGLDRPLITNALSVSNVTINNLTIQASTMEGYQSGGSLASPVAGMFIGYAEGAATLKDCKTVNCTIISDDYAGGLIAYACSGSKKIEIIDCSVLNSTIKGESVGGMVGHATGNIFLSGTVGNNTITSTDKYQKEGSLIGTINSNDGSRINVVEIEKSKGTLTAQNGTELYPVGRLVTANITITYLGGSYFSDPTQKTAGTGVAVAPYIIDGIGKYVIATAIIDTTDDGVLNGDFYTSLNEAIENAIADQTVTLWQSVNEDITVDKNITIYIGENTINGKVIMPNEVSLTIKGTSTENNIVLPTLLKDHHFFAGWYSDPNFTNEALLVNNTITTAVESGTTFYAKFEKSAYSEHPKFDVNNPHNDRTFDFGSKYYGSSCAEQSLMFVYNGTIENAKIVGIDENQYFETSFDGLTVTIVPKSNLAVGTYEEFIRITMHDGSTHTIIAKLVVNKANAVIDVDTSDIVVVQGQEWQLPSASTNVGVIETDKTVADMNSVGVYTVTYSVEGTDNYEGDSKQIKVTVILNPSDVQDNLDKLEKELSDAITNLNTALNNKADKNALETAVNELTSAYKEADETLNKALQGQITANANEIADLKTKLTNAESTLEDAIKKVAADLEAAKNYLQDQIDTLTTSVGANATDIAALEKAISDLDTAYKAADAIMGGRLDALESADATIKESIQALKSNLTATDEALDRAIQALKAELDKAVADLEKSIADGDKGLQDKADALTAAYKAADEAINSEIVKLKAEDATIKQSVADLQAALTSARSELKGLIDKVQKNLDDAEAELREAIAQNKTDLSKEISDLKAAKAELEKLIADIKTELESKINDVKTALEKAENDLNNAIAQNRTDLTGEIEALRKAMEDADALIKGNITELENADAAIIKDIAELEASLAGAKTELEVAIAKVQSNLDTAVDDLNNAIAQNKTDLSAEIKAVEAALKNADSIINGKIADLIAEDTKINASISSLENSIANTKTELKGLIDTVSKNLETAKSELEAAIATGDTALDEKITALDKAYKAADTLIKGEIAELAADDEEISAGITELEASLAAVKSELEAAIAQVQKNLDNAKAELAAKDADLEAKYGELNSKITLLVVIISVVGAISVGGAVAIVIALAKKRI